MKLLISLFLVFNISNSFAAPTLMDQVKTMIEDHGGSEPTNGVHLLYSFWVDKVSECKMRFYVHIRDNEFGDDDPRSVKAQTIKIDFSTLKADNWKTRKIGFFDDAEAEIEVFYQESSKSFSFNEYDTRKAYNDDEYENQSLWVFKGTKQLSKVYSMIDDEKVGKKLRQTLVELTQNCQ